MAEEQGTSGAHAPTGREASAGIVRALLCIAPPATSRETRTFLQQLRQRTIPEIYNRILLLNKLSNKELLHYITVMNAHPFYSKGPPDGTALAYGSLDLEALVNMKFPAQDKYLSQVAIEYFGVVEKVYARLTERQRLEIFVRYLYLFDNNICNDVALYRRFAFVLRGGFLDVFLQRQFYLNFSFIKEFLVEFRTIGSSSVKIGYEVPHMRELVLHLALDDCARRACWLARHWRVPSPFTVADMFYLFDCAYFIEDCANRHLCMESDILDCLSQDLGAHGYCLSPENIDRGGLNELIRPAVASRPACANESHVGPHEHGGDVAAWAARSAAAKLAFARAVQAFNGSMQPGSLAVSHLRISPQTDLKVLGEFLCKPGNLGQLEGFARSFEFQKLDILESLRAFLSSFYMLGESQIIERTVRVFVAVYLEQNGMRQDADFDRYKSLVYSFVVLNTMLHNPSVEKRPSFDEYCRLVGYAEGFVIDGETLRSYYASIRDREIKLPTSWEDSYDKYLLSLKLSTEPAPCTDGVDTEVEAAPPTPAAWEEAPVAHPDGTLSSPLSLCAGCILLSYRCLFVKSYRAFFSMNPLNFARACKLMGSVRIYEEYITAGKQNLNKALEAFGHYIVWHAMKPELAGEFLLLLGHILKPKASVFSEIKSLFSASKPDLHSAESAAGLVPYVLQPYVAVFNDLLGMRFVSQKVCDANLRLLYEAAAQSSTAETPFFQSFVTSLLLENIQATSNVSYLGGSVLAKAVQRNPSLLGSLSDEQKLAYLSSKKELDSHDWDVFARIRSSGPAAFEVFCKSQGKFSNMDAAVRMGEPGPPVVPDTGAETWQFGDFTFTEKYADALRDPNNVVKLFSTSNSVLNLKIAKGLHKDGCPLDNPAFLNFNAIAYMLGKSHRGPSALQGYALRIIACFAESLTLLVRLFTYVYSVLPCLDPSFRHSLLQILLKRLQSFHRGGNACCALHPDADVSDAGNLVRSLLSDSYIAEEDVSFMHPEPGVVEL